MVVYECEYMVDSRDIDPWYHCRPSGLMGMLHVPLRHCMFLRGNETDSQVCRIAVEKGGKLWYNGTIRKITAGFIRHKRRKIP